MLKAQTLLIVEDNLAEAAKIQRASTACGMKPAICKDMKDIEGWLAGNHLLDYAIVDIHLDPRDKSKTEGIKAIKDLKEKYPDAHIVAFSSNYVQAENEEIMQAGASFFARKPIDEEGTLETLLSTARCVDHFRYGRVLEFQPTQQKRTNPNFRFSLLNEVLKKYPHGIVVDDEIVKFIEKILRKAPDCHFLITGPTGSGKEQIAKLIYKLKSKETKTTTMPFEVQNCSFFNMDVGASNLFGHKRGAFTGADSSRKGAIANANGGVLLLDEFQDLNLSFQGKMLRFLQDRSYQPLGSDETLYANVQLIFASNADFPSLIREGKFRDDLYYRINSGEIVKLKPLKGDKERIRDVAALFFANQGVDIPEKSFERLMKQCNQFDWTGNIRSLVISLERYLRHVDGEKFDDVDLENTDLDLTKNASDLSIGTWAKAKLEENPNAELLEEFKIGIVEFFKSKGMTQDEMARKLGVSRNTVIALLRKSKESV